MSLGVLNNISAIYAANNLSATQASLQTTLQQLSSGSRINSGADDAAGLSLANGLQANAAALTQSSTNASEGVGLLQVADGALSQVTNLLNRAVTLSTEASNGTLNNSQLSAADSEYQSILDEISNIGSTTTYNGQAVFGGTFQIFTGDGSASGTSTDTLKLGALSSANVGDPAGSGGLAYAAGAITYTPGTGESLTGTDLTSNANASIGLTDVYTAIQDVAAERGYVGSQINTLNAVSNVESTEQTNVTSAENSVMATDYASATSNLSKFEILSQTGISALAQANSMQQMVTKLLQ